MIPKRDVTFEAVFETRDETILRRMSPLEILCEQKIIETDRPFSTRNDPRCLNVLFESPVISYYDGFGTPSSLNGPHSDPLGV
jgi:hypothetical protein